VAVARARTMLALAGSPASTSTFSNIFVPALNSASA
jgi:hypothetical protein